MISQKLARYLLALQKGGAILQTSKVRNKRKEVTAIKIFSRFKK